MYGMTHAFAANPFRAHLCKECGKNIDYHVNGGGGSGVNVAVNSNTNGTAKPVAPTVHGSNKPATSTAVSSTVKPAAVNGTSNGTTKPVATKVAVNTTHAADNKLTAAQPAPAWANGRRRSRTSNGSTPSSRSHSPSHATHTSLSSRRASRLADLPAPIDSPVLSAKVAPAASPPPLPSTQQSPTTADTVKKQPPPLPRHAPPPVPSAGAAAATKPSSNSPPPRAPPPIPSKPQTASTTPATVPSATSTQTASITSARPAPPALPNSTPTAAAITRSAPPALPTTSTAAAISSPTSPAARAPPPPLPAAASRPPPPATSITPSNTATFATVTATGSTAPPDARLIDYFLVFGRGTPNKISGENSSPSLADFTFSGELLPGQRYPTVDYTDTELSPNVSLFAFPTAVRIITCETKQVSDPYSPSWLSLRPTLHRFVLTKLNGNKQYGACLTFYERMSDAAVQQCITQLCTAMPQLSKQALQQSVSGKACFAPKALCLLSIWPFFTLFEEVLRCLYRLSHCGILLTSSNNSPPTTYSLPLPLERYVAHFCAEVPVPAPGSSVSFALHQQSIMFAQTALNKLPMTDCDLSMIFRLLEPTQIIALFTAVATEQKVVLCCKYANLLMHVAEAICSFLFPLRWAGVYMPLLPESMIDFLYAPVPFLAGILSSYVERGCDIPEEVVFVDLDKREIRIPSQDTIPVLPEKEYKKLLKELKVHGNIFNPQSPLIALCNQAFPAGQDLYPYSQSVAMPASTNNDSYTAISSVSKADKNAFNAEEIRYAFLRVWVKLLMEYRRFLPASTADDPSPSYDREGFLRQYGSESPKSFLHALVHSQMFSQFIDERRNAQEELQHLIGRMGYDQEGSASQNGMLSDDSDDDYEIVSPPNTQASHAKLFGREAAFSYLPPAKSPATGVLSPPQSPTLSSKQPRGSKFFTNPDRAAKSPRAAAASISCAPLLSHFFSSLDQDPSLMPTLAQILFFDECIIAKTNRSNFTKLSNKIRATPFLHDERISNGTVHEAASASHTDLPVRQFAYPEISPATVSCPAFPVFPALRSELYGPVRSVPTLLPRGSAVPTHRSSKSAIKLTSPVSNGANAAAHHRTESSPLGAVRPLANGKRVSGMSDRIAQLAAALSYTLNVDAQKEKLQEKLSKSKTLRGSRKSLVTWQPPSYSTPNAVMVRQQAASPVAAAANASTTARSPLNAAQRPPPLPAAALSVNTVSTGVTCSNGWNAASPTSSAPSPAANTPKKMPPPLTQVATPRSDISAVNVFASSPYAASMSARESIAPPSFHLSMKAPPPLPSSALKPPVRALPTPPPIPR